MKKSLLTFAFAGMALCGAAESYNVYLPGRADADGNPLPEETLGSVYGVSHNGRWAAITDDENQHAYLWNVDTPWTMQCIDWTDEAGIPGKTEVHDVNDQGTAVGLMYVGDGMHVPAVYRDGAWERLPMSDNALNLNFAHRISNDGKYISGVQMIINQDVETGGGWRACRWTLGEDGEYTLESFDNFPEMYNHNQGFYITDMSEDGRVITGQILCGATTCMIPALCVDGEYIAWNNIEVKMEEFIYKGQVLDVYEEYYIDGYHDTDSSLSLTGGFLSYDDATGIAYGHRTRVENPDEEGNATLLRGACAYDTNTGEWTDDMGNSFYNVALGERIFTKGNTVLVNGQRNTLEDLYGIELDVEPAGIQDVAVAGHVLGGMHQVLNPATMEYNYFPMMIVSGSAGVQAPEGIIEGEAETEYYTLQGIRVAAPAEGIYIVRRGSKVSKELVRNR